MIDRKSPIPIYFQIKNQILDNIKNQIWKKEEVIPSERELSSQFHVSRMTVRQAMNELVEEGILYREKGRGTFISSTKIAQKNIMSFSEIVKSIGMKPSTTVLAMELQAVRPEIADKLAIAEDSRVYRVVRLRSADNIPVAVEENYIPELYCPGLDKYDLSESLYKILDNYYQYRIEKMDVKIEAKIPDKQDKKILNLENEIPLLKVSGVSFSQNGKEIIYEESLYRSDKFHYNVSIYNRKAEL